MKNDEIDTGVFQGYYSSPVTGLLKIYDSDTATSGPYVKLVFPHVALVAVVCLYAVIGAYIFYRLESPNEDRDKVPKGSGRTVLKKNYIDSMTRYTKLLKNNMSVSWYNTNDDVNLYQRHSAKRPELLLNIYGDVRITSKLDSSEEKDDSDRTKRHRIREYRTSYFIGSNSLCCICFVWSSTSNYHYWSYIVLMLAYLGVGLAVTTMCIDLVGIQYIQKIHYFGRKFRGTDLLHLLKRKRMIERRLAMGQGEEILQMYIQQIQGQIPETVVFEEKCEEEKCSSHIELVISRWQIDDAMIGSRYCYDYSLAEKVPSPNVLSIRRMFSRYRSRGASWDESGPSLSEHCSLSTEPSVHIRQEYWDNFCSPNPSLTSFEFEFPLPSPDYHGIALSARRSRRIRSCPSDTFDFPPLSQSVRKLSLQQQLPRFSTQHDPLLLPPESFRISEPFMLSKLAAQCDLYDRLACALRFQSPRQSNLAPACEPLCDKFHYPSIRSPDEVREHPGIPKLSLEESPPNSSRSRISARFNPSLYPIPERRTSTIETKDEGPEPLLKRKKKERLARLNDPLHDVDWLNVSPRTKIIKLVRDDLPKLFAHVRNNSKSTDSNASSVVLVSPRNPIGLACMEDWDSYIRMLEEYNKPYEGVMESTPSTPRMSSPVQAPKTSTLPSTVEAPTTLDSSLRELVLEKPNVLCSPPKLLSPSISPPVTEPSKLLTPPRVVTPITINVEPEFEVLTEECEDGGEHEIIRIMKHNSTEFSPMAAESSSEDETASGFDLDLGAFELVDSGMSAETLLNTEDPVIFHQDLPVHSVHHDTVQTEAALANLMSAPSSMLTGAIPPTMVEDNYCFVVDGERVRMGDILGDDQWWRHTSRPTKYFYSEDLRQFHRVNCIAAKGKVITAKLATGTMHNCI
uniref:RING-type domain-containing protein n=1 Tax=Heterorhabditis bacteriophora TaxID=37862 RepID=A0A1I7WRZ7_HETBA